MNPSVLLYGFVAQLVEQRIENPCVTGSNPVRATIVRCESGQIGLPGKECVGNGTRVRIPSLLPNNGRLTSLGLGLSRKQIDPGMGYSSILYPSSKFGLNGTGVLNA